MKGTAFLILFGLVAGASSCSLLLHDDVKQCDSSQDCEALGFKGWVCHSDHVCAENSEASAGAPSQSGASGSTNGGSASAGNSSGGSTSGNAGSAGTPNGGATNGGSAGSNSAGSGGISAGSAGTAGGGGSAGSGGTAGSAANGGAGGSAGSGGSGGSGPPPCKDTECQAANGACNGGICVIECNVADCNPVCPAGMPCRVQCGTKSCNMGIDCSQASSCDVACGMSSCLGGVNCGGSSCTVGCDGDYSCSTSPISCHAATCDIRCPGLQSCKAPDCQGATKSCSLDCSGIQTCGTLFGTSAPKTTISCTGPDSCMAKAIQDACCTGGAICTGAHKPTCN